ncbi:MAG: Lpg1974 family pore-forming outer membrane protein [Legionellales bacterium]|jgi:hypothetical protein
MEKSGKILLLASMGSLMFAHPLLALANKNSVYIEDEEDSWELGASALYLQPSSSENFAYATVETLDGGSYTHAVDRDFDWGYDVFLRYHFEEHDRDLALNYMHFSNGDSDDIDLGGLNPNYNYNKFYYTAEGSVDTHVDMIDLMAGQYVNFGRAVQLHFVAGVAYARVKQVESAAYDEGLGEDSIDAPLAQEAYETFNSTFEGVGPKFGINADYEIYQSDFGLVGGLSYALLIGSQDHSNEIITANGPNPDPDFNYVNNDFDSTSLVVSNINANLGIAYEYEYSDEEEQVIGLELGYQVNQFLDVAYDDQDVNLAGPYLTLRAAY